MARTARKQPIKKDNRANPSTDPNLRTVSAEALLVDGSDSEFRSLIHNLMAVGNTFDVLREGFAKLVGVTPPQHELLMLIYRANNGEGLSVGELASQVKLTSAFIATETNKLSAAGLIDKVVDPKDRRRVILKMTDFGRGRFAFLSQYQRAVNDVIFSAFDHREFLALSQFLSRLLPCSERASDLLTFLVREYERGSERAVTSPEIDKTQK